MHEMEARFEGPGDAVIYVRKDGHRERQRPSQRRASHWGLAGAGGPKY